MPRPTRHSRRVAALLATTGAVLAMVIAYAGAEVGLVSVSEAQDQVGDLVQQVTGGTDAGSAGASPTATATVTVSEEPVTESPSAQPSSTGGTCSTTPDPAPVDTSADPAVGCLLATLDGWLASGRTGLGQQVNISNDRWARPLNRLGTLPALVGFDADELVDALDNGSDRTSDLASLADQGVLLTASWHAPNPWTGGSSDDTTGQGQVAELLDTGSAAGQAFWADYDRVLDRFAALGERGAAVLFRPLHEANGTWFWWGGADASTLTQLYAAMQDRAAERGVHNLAWAYSANVVSVGDESSVTAALPARVDLVGIDSYCDVSGSDGRCTGSDGVAVDAVPVTGYSALSGTGLRAAFTEIGPRHDYDGRFSPVSVGNAAAAQADAPAYALFWFDDSTGRKQIASLDGGLDWFTTCTAVCSFD
ncbi:glycosyl hydrolase [Nocardioides bruguierae]|uniref:glycosyl hydrolase n=1 Tax=Nocardioides bruguierae TaxID=2945102 RepID=UPI002021D35D|nr:glycosyl hydrolase [Nocardioides bruguierae]MCL8026785.1 hypothetical protein [Nocardioides bruguierae]